MFAVIYLIKEKRLESVALNTPGIKYLWVLCALGFVSAVVNNNDAGTIVAILLAAFFLVGAFARSVMTRRLFDSIVKVSCAASLFTFAVALIQYVTNNGDVDRACSVFINANYYAAVTEIIVLFAAYRLFSAESVKQKGFYALVIALNSIGLYLTGCRAGLFALCAAVLLMLLLDGRYKTFGVFLGFCALLVVLMYTLPEIFPRMDQVSTDMDTRIQIWGLAIKGILSHLVLGEGALAYSGFHLQVYGETVVHTHSIYLEPLLSFGILGTVLILIYLKKNLSPIFKMRNIQNDRSMFVLAAGLLTSVAIHGIVDITAFGVQTGILLLLTLSIAGIQENAQPVFTRLPESDISRFHRAGQDHVVYASKDKTYYSNKSM